MPVKLEIRLFAGLKCNNPSLPCYKQGDFTLEVPEGTTVQELHKILELESPLPLITLVNGLSSAVDRMLADNDRVGIFPPVGGG